jgi:GNAT superfamily N-acetyltransferase
VIASMTVEDGLGSRLRFSPEEIRRMLGQVAARQDTEVVVAATMQGRLVGYVVILPPDPIERWGRDPALPITEVAALEVANAFRRLGLAKAMLELALAEGTWDERIVLAPLYSEQWDLYGAGLAKGAYRRMLVRLFQRFGFAEFATDEPEIVADPSNRLLVRVGQRVGPDVYRRFSSLLSEPDASSIRQINLLPEPEREQIYARLIPDALFEAFGIDRRTLADGSGRRLVTFFCPADEHLVRIEVRLNPEDRDCVYLLKLDQTFDGDLELGFIIINDLRAERFDIDRDEAGRDTRLGTEGRNLKEEERAMAAGLAPGQARRGLRLYRTALRLVETFSASLGKDRFVLESNYYHLAVLCEKYGFGYLLGREEMERYHQAFASGGPLQRRLDGSTPFRGPGMERTARGRSWAIHDGILDEPWKPPRMFKPVGKALGIATAPGLMY